MERERLECVKMTKAQREIIRMVLDSLRKHPSEWTVTKHTATNEKTGVEVWHANRFYAVGVSGPGFSIGGESRLFAGMFGRFGWQGKICAAVDAIGLSRLSASSKGGAA